MSFFDFSLKQQNLSLALWWGWGSHAFGTTPQGKNWKFTFWEKMEYAWQWPNFKLWQICLLAAATLEHLPSAHLQFRLSTHTCCRNSATLPTSFSSWARIELNATSDDLSMSSATASGYLALANSVNIRWHGSTYAFQYTCGGFGGGGHQAFPGPGSPPPGVPPKKQKKNNKNVWQ